MTVVEMRLTAAGNDRILTRIVTYVPKHAFFASFSTVDAGSLGDFHVRQLDVHFRL
jgi:hypothetical protein